jgi:Ribbon-helix-helix domain
MKRAALPKRSNSPFIAHFANPCPRVPAILAQFRAMRLLRMVMKRTALFLKEEQVKKLQALSDKTGAPVAELIRRAIDKYLQERAKELK